MSPSSSSRSKKARRKGGKSKSSNIGIWIVGISIGVVVLAVAVLAIANNRPATSIAIAAPDVPAEWLDRSSMGNPEATVVIQTWEDFLCPACRDWSSRVKPRVVDDYVKPGLVRMEFHNFPLQAHQPGSGMAAIASECAADQGAFWPYHDRLFQVQAGGQPAYQMERLVDYAEQLEIDSEQLTQCISSGIYAAAVDESYGEAVRRGLNSTPSIVVNDKVMANPFDYNALKAEIDRLLEASEGNN